MLDINSSPFQANVPFPYTPKTSENLCFSDISKGYRKGTLNKSGLKIHQENFKNFFEDVILAYYYVKNCKLSEVKGKVKEIRKILETGLCRIMDMIINLFILQDPFPSGEYFFGSLLSSFLIYEKLFNKINSSDVFPQFEQFNYNIFARKATIFNYLKISKLNDK